MYLKRSLWLSQGDRRLKMVGATKASFQVSTSVDVLFFSEQRKLINAHAVLTVCAWRLVLD